MLSFCLTEHQKTCSCMFLLFPVCTKGMAVDVCCWDLSRKVSESQIRHNQLMNAGFNLAIKCNCRFVDDDSSFHIPRSTHTGGTV